MANFYDLIYNMYCPLPTTEISETRVLLNLGVQRQMSAQNTKKHHCAEFEAGHQIQ